MLLVPIYYLQTQQLKKFLDRYGNIQIIMPHDRIQFYKIIHKKKIVIGRPFLDCVSCWICWKINLERDVIFV